MKLLFRLLFTLILMVLIQQSAFAQDTSGANSKYGKLSGYVFGDYYYKAHADSSNRGNYQYSGVPENTNAFQLRRIYLNYDYNISPEFSTQLLLAAESSDDARGNNKLSFYIKLANLRWKGILPRTDLVIGQMYTPTYATLVEKIWGYRSDEKTITDMHGSGSYDLGVSLRGRLDAQGHFGYNIMVGNGTGAKPEKDRYKKFYGELYGKFFDRHMIIDLYADYERIDWKPGFHHSRNMYKGFAAYRGKRFTAGTEIFINRMQNAIALFPVNNPDEIDSINGKAFGISAFMHGTLIKYKLDFFARYDYYNPDIKLRISGQYHYTGLSEGYDPNNKEQFITAGLDFTPIENVHFMPNVWCQAFTSQDKAVTGSMKRDYDLVYRMTFYFIYK